MRLTTAEYLGFRSAPNRPQKVRIPARDPKPGAKKAKCPHIAGHAYEAHTTLQIGEEVSRREMRVTITELTDHEDGGWVAVIVAGDRTDQPRLLAKAGGDLDADGNPTGYTASSSRALSGDLDSGEAVPEHVQRTWSRQAFQRDELLRSQRIAKARAGVDALWKGGKDEISAARVIDRHLSKLEDAGEQSEAA
jgi:hypothetical protein